MDGGGVFVRVCGRVGDKETRMWRAVTQSIESGVLQWASGGSALSLKALIKE